MKFVLLFFLTFEQVGIDTEFVIPPQGELVVTQDVIEGGESFVYEANTEAISKVPCEFREALLRNLYLLLRVEAEADSMWVEGDTLHLLKSGEHIKVKVNRGRRDTLLLSKLEHRKDGLYLKIGLFKRIKVASAPARVFPTAGGILLIDGSVVKRVTKVDDALRVDTLLALPEGSKCHLLFDADGNGIDDIVYLLNGRILYARGLRDGRLFLPDTSYSLLFSERFQFSPSLALLGDTVFIARNNGRVEKYYLNGKSLEKVGEFSIPLPSIEKLGGNPYPVIRFYDLTGDGIADMVVGTRWGVILLLLGPDFKKVEEIKFTHPYSSPFLLDGELYAGTGEGKIIKVSDLKPLKVDVPCSLSIFPVTSNIMGDGKLYLVVGTEDGYVYFFEKSSDGFELREDMTIYAGELAVPEPFDFDGDGDQDLLVSNVEGEVIYFENQKGRFLERFSYRFRDSLSSYYLRYYHSSTGFPFYVALDTLTVEKYLSLLKRTPQELVDEVAFVIANTPVEVLRTIASLDEVELLLENARAVYRADSVLDYVRLIELEGGLTTALYDDKDTLPVRDYYFFVVHPRLIYEVPLRVVTDYWDISAQEYGIPYEEWLTHEEDIYRKDRKGEFWRTFFFEDKRYGSTVIDVVKQANTLKDAVQKLYYFQGPEAGGFMKFGYKTQDIQPILIYKKAYGSCGEQSILFASLARTVLIPCYIAIDMGEDHQWDEVWYNGDWHHLDPSIPPKKAMDRPIYSSEKLGSKTVSCVVGWRGDDRHFYITKRGYTDTAVVNFKVIDGSGHAIDGGLILLRSHWADRNALATWGYTDGGGWLKLGLGFHPKGYSVEVLTPYGVAGTNNLYIEEGKVYHFTFQVEGEKSTIRNQNDRLPDGYKLQTENFVFARNPITSTPRRIKSKTLKDAGYEGTGYEIRNIGSLPPVVKKSEDGFLVVNPSPFSYMKVKISRVLKGGDMIPSVNLKVENKSVYEGTTLSLKGEVEDNTGIKTLKVLIRGKKDKKVFDLTDSLRFMGVLDRRRAEFTANLNLGLGGPLLPGNYDVGVVAEDFSGHRGSAVEQIKILPANEFKDQPIFQDETEDTVLHCSWKMEFEIVDEPRFILIETDSRDDIDLDVFLVIDKDGDGVLEKKEAVKRSTSPTASERIYYPHPEKGKYHLLIQGFRVEKEPAHFNLRTSFTLDEEGRVVE